MTSPITIRRVQTPADAREAASVFAAVWTTEDGRGPVSVDTAWAFAHTGNYIALAQTGTRPVGAAIGFRGNDEHGDYLHSDITGVLSDCQGKNIGYLLKQHQRRWALTGGLDRMVWTFDPLIARNAFFNVAKLGAQITGYLTNYYGEMHDGVNAGDETDRCLVTWWLTNPRPEEANLDLYRAAGAVDVLRCTSDLAPEIRSTNAPLRLLHLPSNATELRREAPDRARTWRLAVREVMLDAFRNDLHVIGVSRDHCYVLGPAANQPPRRVASGAPSGAVSA